MSVSQTENPGHKSKAKLWAALSAITMLVVGAVVSPLGGKLANLIWPDPPADGSVLTLPSAPTLPNGEGCRAGGPPLSITMSYNFRGATWWATDKKLPSTLVGDLNVGGGADPAVVLAQYSPVQSQVDAGTRLKLIATGCGPKAVVITNILATVSKRDKPLSGGVVSRRPQGSVEVTAIGFDLDQPEPAALTYDARMAKLGEPYFATNAMQVAPGEAVPFEIMALTQKSSLEWSLRFETLVDGNPWNFGLTLPQGQPIRSTAVAPAYESAIWINAAITGYETVDSDTVVKFLRGE